MLKHAEEEKYEFEKCSVENLIRKMKIYDADSWSKIITPREEA
jgi:hypothetical protein